MRTTLTLDEDVHEFATYYARAKGLTLSAAIGELVRKGRNAPEPEPDVRRGPNGFPMFPPSGSDSVVTDEMVRRLEEDEFDPKKFA